MRERREERKERIEGGEERRSNYAGVEEEGRHFGEGGEERGKGRRS